ncbi:hypothetical protein N7445_010400 [Penicillium cf. griseofulvum]|nr:hypothetical protein N7445_010400 [Penicillium cf. griseofulvum]
METHRTKFQSINTDGLRVTLGTGIVSVLIISVPFDSPLLVDCLLPTQHRVVYSSFFYFCSPIRLIS